MRQALHDMPAVSGKLGHPDVFLTMTCNPKWPEITRELKPGQTPVDRPDLCCRVFNMKIKKLMHVVKEEEIFGKVVAYAKVIEFQKRGLPHAHCIFILDQESKNRLRSPEAVNDIISAEIPPESEGRLRDIVVRHSIHNPCGPQENPSAVCLGKRAPPRVTRGGRGGRGEFLKRNFRVAIRGRSGRDPPRIL